MSAKPYRLRTHVLMVRAVFNRKTTATDARRAVADCIAGTTFYLSASDITAAETFVVRLVSVPGRQRRRGR